MNLVKLGYIIHRRLSQRDIDKALMRANRKMQGTTLLGKYIWEGRSGRKGVGFVEGAG